MTDTFEDPHNAALVSADKGQTDQLSATYRVTHLVANPGWVDLTQPRLATRCVTLYLVDEVSAGDFQSSMYCIGEALNGDIGLSLKDRKIGFMFLF